MVNPQSPDANPESKWVEVELEGQQYSVTPGQRISLPVTLRNLGSGEYGLIMTVEGIPPSWISPIPSAIQISPGEVKEVALTVKPPTTTQVSAERFTFRVRVVSQDPPRRVAEAAGTLMVAAYALQGRIGILMENVQISVVPGGKVNIPVTLINKGLEEDYFKLSVEGLPTGWI